MGCIGTWTAKRTIRQLPGDEDPSLAANSHAGNTLVKAGNQPPVALRKAQGLGIAELRLAVVAEYGFAVLVHYRRAMVIGRIELVPIGGQPTRVMDLEHLPRLSLGAGADLDVLIAK